MTDDLKQLGVLTKQAIDWVNGSAGVFLADRDRQRVAVVQGRLTDLQQRLGPDSCEVPICFLGNAGVGKSTLVNALVDPQVIVVPAGGVGPLTAQATLVRYSEHPYLRAEYHGAQRLNQLIFALTMYIRRGAAASTADAGVIDEATRLELLSTMPESDLDSGDRDTSEERIRAYIGQARLMVTGSQFGDDSTTDVPYLVDALRAALDLPAAFGHEVRPPHRELVTLLAGAVRQGEEVFEAPGGGRGKLIGALKRNATGSLAPLIKKLEVGWPSTTVPAGLVIVDLPGVGIANDEFRSVTAEWIRRARAVVLVVDRSGVSDPSVEMLRTTGYLNTLLHRDPSSDEVSPLLWIAMSKLDDSAKDERDAFKQEHDGEPAPSWSEFFDVACNRGQRVAADQMRAVLQQGRERDEEVAANIRLLRSLRVFPVSAPQYRKFHANDEDDPARINSAAESRIPVLLEALGELAARHRQQLVQTTRDVLRESKASLVRGLDAAVDELRASERQREQVRVLRARFDEMARAPEGELKARVGALRERLRTSIPLTIEREVHTAITAARRQQNVYVGTLASLSWATLRATVRRGGAFIRDKSGSSKRNVDIPNELALRYEAELALVWNRAVVTEIRKAFMDHAEQVRRILGQVVAWARGPDVNLEADLIERLRADIVADLAQLAGVAERRTEQLREQIKLRLHSRVEEEVRAHCQTFVTRRLDVGTGVGQRTKLLVAELPDLLAEPVARLTREFLGDVYQATTSDLVEQFAQLADPIARVRSMLLVEPAALTAAEIVERQAELGRAQEYLGQLRDLFAPVEG